MIRHIHRCKSKYEIIPRNSLLRFHPLLFWQDIEEKQFLRLCLNELPLVSVSEVFQNNLCTNERLSTRRREMLRPTPIFQFEYEIDFLYHIFQGLLVHRLVVRFFISRIPSHFATINCYNYFKSSRLSIFVFSLVTI